MIEERDFFIKGNLDIPVLDADECFSWTVWVSLSRSNFERARQVWDNPNRVEEPRYFGWLSTRIPIYPETLNLKANIHTRAVGIRPYIEIQPTDHPLAKEQREGITVARVCEIAELLLHS
jgi:hypothetical protein